jgi:hypothetical protein
MQADTKARWLDVCAEAAICEDPTPLAELIKEIAETESRGIAAGSAPIQNCNRGVAVTDNSNC